jgi:hypothetical protein
MLRVWGRSFLLRYEPSGVVGFAYRVRQRERLAATTPQVLTATGYEQLAGAIAAVAGFLLAGVDPPLAALVLLTAIAAVALALRPAWLGERLARGAPGGLRLWREAGSGRTSHEVPAGAGSDWELGTNGNAASVSSSSSTSSVKSNPRSPAFARGSWLSCSRASSTLETSSSSSTPEPSARLYGRGMIPRSRS